MRFLFLASLLACAASAAPVNLALHRPAAQSSVHRNDPTLVAAKGVDGFKYDTSLFQTEEEDGPWWEVDLGRPSAIENVMLYNRVGCCQENVRGFQLLLSSDGVNYVLVYTHDKYVFRNRRVDIGGLTARFVRVQLPRRGSLQLQEVEIYQYGTWLPSTQPVRGTPVRIARRGPWFGGSAAAPAAPVGNATIEGRWSVNFNGYRGTMEFTRSGSGWAGRLNLDAGNEALTNISFDPRTGSVAFLRGSVNQRYRGSLSGNHMSGQFDNTSPWSATRSGAAPQAPVTQAPAPPSRSTPAPAPAPVSAGGATIEGRWSVNFNEYRGTMEFTRSGSGWSGRLNLGSDEPLTNISFDPRTGSVAFLRGSVSQRYRGTLSGNRMSGMFDNISPWSATRSGAAPQAPVTQAPAPPSRPAPVAAPAPVPAGGATIEGLWSVNFNGYRGTMEFSRRGSGWSGRLNLGSDEPLTSISFDPRTGSIAFVRGSVGQRYRGTLSGNRMSGMFDNISPWSATRSGAAPQAPVTQAPAPALVPSGGATIEGRWSVDFVGLKGTMEFTRSGSGWSGRLNLDAGNEALTNISFDPRTGSVAFLRGSVNQRYRGTLSGNRMSGQFDNTYPWSATRSGAAPAAASPAASLAAASPTIEGRWSVNFNGYRGTMEFTRSGSGWSGRLNLDAGNEALTNVSFDPRTGSVAFLRGSVNQHYRGTLSGNRMSGLFDNASPWSATR